MIATRLGLQQRVLPAYRAAFFDALAQACQGGLGVFAGAPRPEEALGEQAHLSRAQWTLAGNHHWLSGRGYVCWQSGLVAWLERWQPDVLIVEANPRYLSTPQAVRWMHGRRRPVVGWGLGAPARGGVLAGVRRKFLGQFDVLLTYSQQGAQEYQAAGFEAQRIFVAPNAVTPRPAHPLPERGADFDPQGPSLLFVGRLQERKRVDLLLRACAALPVERQPRLCVVGDGPARPGLEELARQIYPRCEFPGARHGAELETCFRRADLFVLPGTGGLAVQQAMSFGLPVVVAEADGTQSNLVRPENGWQLAPGSLDDLIATLQEALQNAPRLRQMGEVSYRIVAEEINIERMVTVFEQAVVAAQAIYGRGRSNDAHHDGG